MQFLIEIGGPVAETDPRLPPELESHRAVKRVPVARIREEGLQMTFGVPEGDPEYRMWTERGRLAAGESFVFVLGWCYRIDSSSPSLSDSDLTRFLERHRAGEAPADENVSGNYVIIAYDAKTKRIAVQPDHDAWSSVFFSQENGHIAVSNRAVLVASLMESPLDGYAILSFLRGTFIPLGRSLFGGVRRILSGCYLEIDTRGARASLRRAIPLYVPTRPVRRRDAVSRVSETVRSLARRLTEGEDVVFDLTGGMDTRLLAAGVRRIDPSGIGTRFTWNVVGSADLADSRVAADVAQALRWPFRRLDRISSEEADPPALVADAVLSDGNCLIDAAFSRLRHEEHEGGSFSRAGGMGGELLRGWLWGQEFLKLGRTSRVNFNSLLLYRFRPSKSIDTAGLGNGWPTLREHDDAILEPYRSIADAGGDRVNAYKLDVIAQHKLLYLSFHWLVGVRRVRLPFVSWEFCREVLSIPWRLRSTRRLLLQVFADLSPELTRIPTSKGEPMTPLGLGSLPLYSKRVASEVRRGVPFVLARLRRSAPHAKSAPPPPPQSWTAVLREAQHVPTFFDPAFVRAGWDFDLPTADRLRVFHTLLTLELLCRGLPRVRKQVAFPDAEKLA
jgi:hypothetical protein